MKQGKADFYKKAEEAFSKEGYLYYSEKDIPGIGRAHASKPDYLAQKGGNLIIGEIKSPAEQPDSPSWRQAQSSDSDNFRKVRISVAQKEATGHLPKEIGGHEIIIRGQIPDYISKLNKTYILPEGVSAGMPIWAGYTFPVDEKQNVNKAISKCGLTVQDIIDTGNGPITYVFRHHE